MLDATGEGIFAPPLRGVVPTEGEQIWDVYETERVAGTLRSPAKLRDGVRATMSFTAPTGARRAGLQSGEVACTVVDNAWSCDVPRGTWDVRFRVESFASHYAIDFNVPTPERHALHTVALVYGASLTGRVELGRHLPKDVLPLVAVALAPVATPAPPANGPRVASGPKWLKVNARGFFSFEGVAPGDYSVFAMVGKQYVSNRETVRIIGAREATLTVPLRLEPPRQLHVSVVPAVDTELRPWVVRLDALRDEGRRFVAVTESVADELGRWSASNLLDGEYSVTVRDRDGNSWHNEAVRVDGSDRVATVSFPLSRVRGSVTLGEAPIGDAAVRFSRDGVPGIALRSDADGHFAGPIPVKEPAGWTVSVESEAASVNRTFRNVTLTRAPAGDYEVELALLATHLSGVVTYENGDPADNAIITISAADAKTDEFVQTRSQATGEFAINGLPAGKYLLRAEQMNDESDTVAATVDPGGNDAADVRITLRAGRSIAGIVYSDAGPVPGAKVWATPTDSERLFMYPLTTDAQGRFTLRLPANSLEVDLYVEAHGFASRLFHERISHDRFGIRVEQFASELSVPIDAWLATATPGEHAFLLHNGAALPLVRARRRADASAVLTLEPGAWSICRAAVAELPLLRRGARPARQCIALTLPPFSRVEAPPPPSRDDAPTADPESEVASVKN